MSARTRGPRNASSEATSSAAGRSPTTGCDGRPRRRSSAIGTPTSVTPSKLERVAGPPRPAAVLEHEDGNEREAEPGHADDDEQVGGAARQREGADGAQGDDAGRSRCRRRGSRRRPRLPAWGSLGTIDGSANAAMPATAMRPRNAPTATAGARRLSVPPQRGERREGEHRAADGQRRAAREGDDPVGADEDAGRREAVDDEQQRHRAEGAAGDQRPGVAAPDAGDRERDAGERRDRRADGHDHEMADAGDGRLTPAREGDVGRRPARRRRSMRNRCDPRRRRRSQSTFV